MDVAVVAGDGIGPEVTAAAVRVAQAAGADVNWIPVPVGQAAYAEYGTALPQSSLEVIRSCGVALKGPLANPTSSASYPSPNMALRRELGLYVNLRRCAGTTAGGTEFDVVVLREMTEGLLTGVEQMVGPDAAVAIKRVTRAATTRFARFVADWAVKNKRSRVSVLHKASALRLVDGLFVEAMQAVIADYPSLTCIDIMVDTAAMEFVRNPGSFDILAGGLQYGDILSDVGAGLLGGPGMIPGATFGHDVAFFESVHGTAPGRAGRNSANPIAMILSAALLLDHVRLTDAARRIDKAVQEVVTERKFVTSDLKGSSTLEQVTDAIAARVSRG
jgi:isocitrate dehydrogenase (NAD+)